MQEQQLQAIQIAKDERNISKYIGLFIARLVLLVCLFCLLAFMLPVSFYLFVYVGVFPWILSNFFFTKYHSPDIVLKFCAKKYSYTAIKLAAEKAAGNVTIFLLFLWQLFLNLDSLSFEALRFAPGLLLFVYLVTRITVTAIMRHKIHNFYTELLILN